MKSPQTPSGGNPPSSPFCARYLKAHERGGALLFQAFSKFLEEFVFFFPIRAEFAVEIGTGLLQGPLPPETFSAALNHLFNQSLEFLHHLLGQEGNGSEFDRLLESLQRDGVGREHDGG